jgi:GT2 family glycosyltransferase
MTKFPVDVSVVIVAHNRINTLPVTLNSLRAAGCPVEKISVVDVASTDGTMDWMRSWLPGIRALRLEANDGPNPGRNLGLTSASEPYVLLMDADVMVEPDTVPMLRSVMAEDANIGIASPVVVYADRPEIIQYAGTNLHFLCEAVNPWQGRSVQERGTAIQDIGVASANALLVSREAARKIGLFDERYFMGKEDGDFTFRMRLAGHRIVEVPQARIRHDVTKRGTGLYYYQLRNRWYLMLKNYQLRTLVFLAPVLVFHELLQLSLLSVKGHSLTYLKAITGLIKMLPGLRAERMAVSRIRVRPDCEVLMSGTMVMREDLLSNEVARKGKAFYEKILAAYWDFFKGNTSTR